MIFFRRIFPVTGFAQFVKELETLSVQKKFSSYDFTAALLYTDEDLEIATYVRNHFDALDKMSGHQMPVFVIEKPYVPLNGIHSGHSRVRRWLESVIFARSQPTKTDYNITPKSIVYNKNEAYDIALRLGLLPNQLPCLVFFHVLDQSDKICIPLPGDEFTSFFRDIFSHVQITYREADAHFESEYPKSSDQRIPDHCQSQEIYRQKKRLNIDLNICEIR
ncbi:MAG: hypothetical protein AAF702_37025 [Chloroflexota bacterium]